jgi:archaellum biogenesis ATPase FlaH
MGTNPDLDKNKEYQNSPLKTLIFSTLEDIESAEEPSFILGSLVEGNAFPIPKNGLTLIIADAGKGKSLLIRALMEQLKGNPDIGFVYADFEFDRSVAKERGINKLIKELEERYILLTPKNEDGYLEFFKNKSYQLYIQPEDLVEFESLLNKIFSIKKLTDRQKVFFAISLFQSFMYKEAVIFVDSLEDLVENTSDDAQVKTIARLLTELRENLTFIVNHHIRKPSTKPETIFSFSFRGSQVWRNKAKSMLYIFNRDKEDDFTLTYEILITKMRVKYLTGVDRVFVRVNTEDWGLDYHFNADKEAVYILKHIYWILRKEKSLTKSELKEAVKKKARKGTQKVEEILKEYENYFSITRKGKAIVYSLPEGGKLFELKRFIGLEDREHEEALRRVAELINKMPNDYRKEVEIDGKHLVITKEALERNYVKYSSEFLDKIYYELASDLLEANPEEYDNLEPLDFDELMMDLPELSTSEDSKTEEQGDSDIEGLEDYLL